MFRKKYSALKKVYTKKIFGNLNDREKGLYCKIIENVYHKILY